MSHYSMIFVFGYIYMNEYVLNDVAPRFYVAHTRSNNLSEGRNFSDHWVLQSAIHFPRRISRGITGDDHESTGALLEFWLRSSLPIVILRGNDTQRILLTKTGHIYSVLFYFNTVYALISLHIIRQRRWEIYKRPY